MIFEQSAARQKRSTAASSASPTPLPARAASTTMFSTTANGRRPNIASGHSADQHGAGQAVAAIGHEQRGVG